PDSVTRLIVTCGAPVLPAFIEGANSPLFYGLGLLHPRLRTAMLPREVLRRQKTQVRVQFGSLIPPKPIERLPIPDATAYLRLRTYALCARTSSNSNTNGTSGTAADQTRTRMKHPHQHQQQARNATTRPRDVASEMDSLVARGDLVEHERFSLVALRAHDAPGVLDEIGRARAT